MVAVCRVEQVPVEGGVAALVGGRAIAIFRTFDGNVHATSNYDPWSHASVMSRGIVGSRGDVPYVASPMHKQAFDLRSGTCLDDETVRLAVHDVRVVDGVVWVGEEVTAGQGGCV
ncbi:nitrite reductase small subunit NirD [Nocardioides daphniae]|nr:nitrite reductase small subunit NirD [Nocardioides daphniae]